MEASAYWKTQLKSDFAESDQYLKSLSGWKELAAADIQSIMMAEGTFAAARSVATGMGGGLHAPKKTKIDGTSETSSKAKKRKELQLASSSSNSRVGYLVIKDSALATYELVLGWLENQQIDPEFGELSPATAVRSPTAPDVVYELAHFLQLERLKELASGSFTQQLTATSAVAHLASKRALTYPELGAAALEVAVKHIDGVAAGNGMAVITSKLVAEDDADFREYLGQVIEKLFKASSERKARDQHTAQKGKKIENGDHQVVAEAAATVTAARTLVIAAAIEFPSKQENGERSKLRLEGPHANSGDGDVHARRKRSERNGTIIFFSLPSLLRVILHSSQHICCHFI